jgi:hypothetical protein
MFVIEIPSNEIKYKSNFKDDLRAALLEHVRQ